MTLFNAFDTFTTYVKMYQTEERKSQCLVPIILSIMIHVAYNFVTVKFDYFLFNDQRDKSGNIQFLISVYNSQFVVL